jgi:hypothetical protein
MKFTGKGIAVVFQSNCGIFKANYSEKHLIFLINY